MKRNQKFIKILTLKMMNKFVFVDVEINKYTTQKRSNAHPHIIAFKKQIGR